MSSQSTKLTRAERREEARQSRLEREREAAAARTRARRVRFAGVTVLAIAAIAAFAAVGKSLIDHAPAPYPPPVAGIPDVDAMLAGIPQHGPVLGRPNAPVTLVEFADPQCPYCSDFALGAMPELIRDYVRPGKLKLELRLLTFLGPDSEAAARAVNSAGVQNRLWNAADLLFWNQRKENSGYVTEDYTSRLLAGVPGLDVARALRERSTATVSDQLHAARALADAHAVDSTPTFLLGRSGKHLTKLDLKTLTTSEISGHIDHVLTHPAGV